MEKTERQGAMPHQLIMQERGRLELTGVLDVDSFDDTVVMVYTTQGDLTVRGSQLHIRQLDVEGGGLSMEGQVDSLVYTASAPRGGFFSRLFR